MSIRYDVLQVCENGHKTTGRYSTRHGERQKFCDKCGAKTITACAKCHQDIQGDQTKEIGVVRITNERAAIPLYCTNCGEPYPWTQKKITAAIQNLVEFGELSEAEKKTIEQDVENIAKDAPEAELSARRIKRIWERGKNVGYEIIMEFASRTAAKILKSP